MCKCSEDPHSGRNLMIPFKTVAALRDIANERCQEKAASEWQFWA